jgi:hypothetical protein
MLLTFPMLQDFAPAGNSRTNTLIQGSISNQQSLKNQ